MVTMGVFPFQGKTHVLEPGIEPGTLWLVVRNSDHQTTRLVAADFNVKIHKIHKKHSDMFRSQQVIIREYVCNSLKLLN